MGRSKVQRSTTKRNRFRSAVAAGKPACWLCGRAIDYGLKYDDPMSFVIDHIIPLARNGTDTLDNVAAAHRQCNSIKRARIVSPIIRRSGSLNR